MPNDGAAAARHPRPWVDHYPPGIKWDVPIDATPVHERFFAAAAKAGDRPALDFLGKVTTYAALARAVDAMAGALQQQLGVTKGTRVALLLPNTPYYVVAYYATLKVGGTVVNCNPLYTIAELTHIVADAGAHLLVTLDLKQLFDKAEALCRAGHVQTLIVCPFADALPAVKSVLFRLARRKDLANVGRSSIADRIVRWNALKAVGAKPKPVAIDPARDPAVQQYTGGTTGLPKGAMLSHANIAANLSQIDQWGLTVFYPPSKVVAVLPFFHIFAMTVCMNVPLGNGIPVIMLPRFELKALLDLLARTGANVLPAVPTLVHAVATKVADPERIKTLEYVISGGASLPNETREAFAKVSSCLLAEGYGLTEASPVVCCAALQVPSKPLSIGQPLPATDLRFVDLETGEVVGVNQRGELQVKGPQVMLGYYNNPEASTAAFDDGWLRTGDVGYVDEDGYVFLVDRIKDLIISSGFNIYPRTVEEALAQHPAVEEVNVIGVPDEYRGEAPVAFVKLADGQTATAEELRKFLADKLSKLELPKEIIFKEQLPKTLIGKLSKKELREEYKQMKAAKRGPQ